MTDELSPERQNAAIDEQISTNQSLTRRFDGVSLASENAATQALIAKQTADVQARWVMALRNPRSMQNVRQVILKEVQRPGFAALAIYRVPRGGTTIKGLTIRTAEVMMRAMGNMNCEAQTLFDSYEERVVRVGVTDFESNTTWTRDITIKKTVERKNLKRGERPIRTRVNSQDEQIYIVDASEDDIRTKEAAEISKASRTGILRLIPGHIQDEVFDVCDEIFTKGISTDVDGQKNKMCDAFATLGIMPTEIERFLGHGIDTISASEIANLQTIYNAIRSGDATWTDAVEGRLADLARRKTAEASKQPQPVNGNGAPADKKSPPPAASSSKGTTAAKDKIKSVTNPSPAVAAPKPEPVAAQPPTPPPAPEPIKDGYEERKCAECGVTVEVPIADPPGAVCYACASA